MSEKVNNEVIAIWENVLDEIVDDCFKYKTIKPMPSEWVEKNLVLPKESSRIAGPYSYDNSPYVRELIDMFHPSNPMRVLTIMKGSQSGITTGLMVPLMMWIICEHPGNFLFTSKDKDVAKRTMRTKFDLFMQKSGFEGMVRSNNTSSNNRRTGDTDFLKEFAGGNGMIESTQNIQNFREFAAKYILMDEFDTAPSSDKKEGSLRSVVEGRQTSFGELAKTVYVSTPTIEQTSNIYKAYLEGDQRKWHWECPSCGSWEPVEFQVKKDNGKYAGIVWKLDKYKKLIPETIRYEFSCCGHQIEFKEKHKINKKGKFIPTAEPVEPNNVSVNINSLILGPGFINWERLVNQWLKACPPGKQVNVELLKGFNNQHLGLPFKEQGKAPKLMQIMGNVRRYTVGQIPNELSQKDGNGRIVTITMAADLGGIMNDDTEDVRVDWEILAHSESGATYSIDQGSIGTFKRKGTMTMAERKDDTERKRWTYNHGLENSVWPELDKIAKQIMLDENGNEYVNSILIIDSGHFTNLVYQYVNNFDDEGLPIECFSIKGEGKKEFIKLTAKTPRISKSPHYPNLYHLDVDSFKDELSDNMKLKLTQDGKQHPGFMNFPEPSKGKYGMKTYFKHFESEVRLEDKKDGEVVGFKWEKKTQENHFWDVRIYNLAAIHIQMDLWRRYEPKKYKNIDYNMFVNILNN